MNAQQAAVILIEEHRIVLEALTSRSPADFRSLPALFQARASSLREAFASGATLPPSLVGQLAPLLSPRLERLNDRLRRRMARARRELPLRRLREMDPACLRINARRPGRTLMEKAGAKQTLRGVVRVERFDTTENRVLKAAAQRLDAQAREVLAHGRTVITDSPTDRVLEVAAGLARLARSSSALLEHPDLAGVGRPRPGERPSNALLGDADYRAAWRALRLLRREEQRYAEEWTRLPELWVELVQAACWDALDGSSWESLPGWTRVLDGPTGPGRLQTSSTRRYFLEEQGAATLLTVSANVKAGAITLTVQRSGRDSDELHRLLPLELAPVDDQSEDASEARHTRAQARKAALEFLGSAQIGGLTPSLAQRASLGPNSAARVGMCWLDRTLQVAAAQEPGELIPSAVALLDAGDEAPLAVTGRQATWSAQVEGPTALSTGNPTQAQHLVRAHAGSLETAVVVPDLADEVTLAALRPPELRTWTVWASVAAALAAAARYPGRVPQPDDGTQVVALVAIDTDAVQEMTALELRSVDHPSGRERLWVRFPKTTHSAPGAEARAGLVDAGAWLRGGWGTESWTTRESLSLHATPPRPAPTEQAPPTRPHPPSLRIAVGEPPDAWRDDDTSFIQLTTADLAEGARVFLERRAAGLPTWVERLPRLDIVVTQERERRPFVLLEPREVSPGELIEQEPEAWFALPHGERRIDLPLQRDGDSDPLVVRLEGGALPLRQPIRVGIRVRFRHGLDGVEGHLIPHPEESGGLARLSFKLARGQTVQGESPAVSARLPRWPAPQALRNADAATIIRACEDVVAAVTNLPAGSGKKRKGARKGSNEQTAFQTLQRSIDELSQGLARLDGPIELRSAECAEAVGELIPTLDWLLGLGRMKGRGRPPSHEHHPEIRKAALRARARTTLRADGSFSSAVMQDSKVLSDPGVRFNAISAAVRSARAPEWPWLIENMPSNLAQRGQWAAALTRCITRAPALLDSVESDDASVVLEAAVSALEQIAEMEPKGLRRRKKDVFEFVLLATACTLFRAGGHLPAGGDTAESAAIRLEAIADRLPADIRSFGGSAAVTADDEPIQVAIDYLRGHYRAMAGATTS